MKQVKNDFLKLGLLSIIESFGKTRIYLIPLIFVLLDLHICQISINAPNLPGPLPPLQTEETFSFQSTLATIVLEEV